LTMTIQSILKPYMQPAFLLCVAVLAVAGSAMSTVKSYLGVKLIKLPLPLQKPLALLNEDQLTPYRVVIKQIIDNPDVLESLGTEDYIQWILEDTEVDTASPVRYCLLFITYYTGTPDQVPHVPEECYLGGGNQRFARGGISFEIPLENTNAMSNKDCPQTNKYNVPATYLTFGKKEMSAWDTSSKFTVFYCFKVNGVYKGNRNTTRLELMSNITGKYSYFSKIEWKFFNKTVDKFINSEKDIAIEASNKLLSIVLPILEREYWPDWQKALNEDKLDNQN